VPPLPGPSILFTAFEPSGDDHSAAVIAELRRRHPELSIFAWGGPKMARAGATIVASTGDDAVVGVPGWSTIKRYLRIQKDIDLWMGEHRPTVHVPVDSPGANFTIAKLAKKHGCKVVHLVAPQLWAWGPWRIRKLRKRTDLVLSILPFEKKWFEARGVAAEFIGHPLFDEPLDFAQLDAEAAVLPRGEVRLAVLPGSRPAELRRNFPVMLEAFRALRSRHPSLVGVVGATTEAVAEQLRGRASALGGWPDGLEVLVGKTDAVVRWCTAAMAVSGTVSLQIAKQKRPMVLMYKTNKVFFKVVGRHVITSPYFTLPNLIAGREIVPELVPYFKGHERLLNVVDALITSADAQERQRAALRMVCERFEGRHASANAADAIERVAGVAAVVARAG
jgi:lipid-A-disaccharide synthase